MIFFKVNRKGDDRSWFGMVPGREQAKIAASRYIGGNPDLYEVTPLTNPGETFWIHTNFQGE